MEQNYRSTKTILAIASELIAKNIRRKEKSLWTENPQGDKAELVYCQDEHDEASVVMRKLKEFNEQQKIPWNEMAVFYRMNSLSRVMEEALFRNKIPYQIARGTEFYNRKEIKDVMAYLRVVANPADEVSLTRIINMPPRGLGDTSLKQIQARAIANGVTLFEALGQASRITGVSTRAANAATRFVELVNLWRQKANIRETPASSETGTPQSPSPGTPGEGWGGGQTDSFSDPNDAVNYVAPDEADLASEASIPSASQPIAEEFLWDAAPLDDEETDPVATAEPFAPPDDVSAVGAPALNEAPSPADDSDGETVSPLVSIRDLMERIVRDSGLEAHLKKIGEQEQAELKNVEELISAAAEYDEQNETGNLADYLAQVSLVSDIDRMEGTGGAVTLMTLHAAKGLEFPVVAIIGIEDGCLPHSRARDNLDELEEERRLFFVGITRAQQRLILTKAQVRTMRGMRERTIPSPFINELPQDHLELTDRTGYADVSRDSAFGRSGAGSSFDREPSYERSLGGFRQGQTVRHPTFGTGKIVELSGAGSKTRAVVDFVRAGRKTLIVEAARLEAVS